MKWKAANLQTRLYLTAVIMLLVGLGSAVIIYLSAENNSVSVLGYEVEGGQVNPIYPEDSKLFIHNLELYGGKANVLVNDFRQWFTSLWHGKSLAFTVASITVVISAGVCFSARHLPPDSGFPERGKSNRRGTD